MHRDGENRCGIQLCDVELEETDVNSMYTGIFAWELSVEWPCDEPWGNPSDSANLMSCCPRCAALRNATTISERHLQRNGKGYRA